MVLSNTRRELPVTLDEIKVQSKKNDKVLTLLNVIKWHGKKKNQPSITENNKTFFISDNVYYE